MTHVTLKSTLIGIALAGTVATLALPGATHASSPYYYGPSQWGKHAISYNDPFSSPGQLRADTSLSFKTHWETTINLSDPSAPIVWTRYKDAGTTLGGSVATTGGIRPADLARGGSRAHPRSNLYDCSTSGGAKLWDQEGFNGNCGKFTGIGTTNLAGLAYPATCQGGFNCSYMDHSKSLSTYGSAASGNLTCHNAQPHFASYTQWGSLTQVNGGCNGDSGWVYSITLNT